MPTLFQKKLATIAVQQFEKHHLLRENQEPLASQIKAYWQDLGFAFPGTATAWSAVFVSWCVQKAGATASQFKFAQAHSQFVFQAIANASNSTGDFRGHPVTRYSPKVGDILHNNRSGNTFDFAFASTHKSYESHSAVVMEVGVDTKGKYLRTIGGNESDSVGMKEVRLNPQGRVINNSGLFISVIETLL
ncbi:DUF2272 domain-containing protein [Variovorax sp. RT4R15]|uniref:DUF2272 domain-containing protein n=1 Tax=Variovorax sp. RT4R15 TaxID=3443737 RepID=UPI003F45455D